MASNSATHVASQQSVKAYVDAQVATKDNSDEITEGSTNLYYTNARVDTHLNQSSAGSGQILGWNGSDYAWVNDSSGSSLTVQEEGSSLSTAATTLNFVGSGVTASGTGATKTITVSGGGSSTGNTTDVTQSSHGFAAKDAIRHNGSSWVKAQADDNSTLALGIVTAVADSNNFTIAQAGRFTISSHGLTVGQWYYVSSSSAGALTATEPDISQPIVYVESASVIFVYPYRPTNILLDGSSGVTPGDNTVTSAKIVDGTIVTADLADDAVTSAKIADDAVGADQIAALTTIDINGGSIDGAVIGANSAAAGTFTTVTDSDGLLRNIPQSGSAKTSSYTLVAGDAGNFIEVGASGSITIPNNVMSAGDAVTLFNNTTGNVTVTCSITTAYKAGTNTDQSSVTLETRGLATILFISQSTCVISGNLS